MPSVTVEVASVLSAFTNDVTRLRAQGQTVGAALEDLLRRHPALRPRLFGDDGTLREHVLIFVNEERVAYRGGAGPTLAPGDRIHVLQAVSGG